MFFKIFNAVLVTIGFSNIFLQHHLRVDKTYDSVKLLLQTCFRPVIITLSLMRIKTYAA